MRATLFIFLWVLFIGLILGASYISQKEKLLPPPKLQSSLFGLIPPQPTKTLQRTLRYQTAPLSYPAQKIILDVAGDMVLAHVNKFFSLPSWYVPPDLISLNGPIKTIGTERIRSIIFDDLKSLFAKAERVCQCKMAVLSAYRSYQTQKKVYNFWVSQAGQAYADLIAARPGHSEHQLGTTVDLTSSKVDYQLTHDFGYTCEGIWLEKNAYRYGFILSYPKGKDAITGYIWEPWHFRYVGREAAQEVNRLGITLEEYLSVE